jgi:hypothetical protein
VETRFQVPARETSNAKPGGERSGVSRIIVGISALIVFLFIVITPFRQGEWSAETIMAVVGADALGVLLVLAVYKPERLRWAGRAATGLVFLAFVAYLIDEISSGGSWHLGPRSEPGSLNALLGLLIFGAPCLCYTLFGRLGRKTEIPTDDLMIHEWLAGQCSQCSKPLAGHDWAGFAGTVATEQNKERLRDFFEKVKEHHWGSVATFQEFDATQNDMLVFAVRCVSGGFVFVVRSAFELFDGDKIYLREAVTQAEMMEIENHVPPDSWHIGAGAASRPSAKSHDAAIVSRSTSQSLRAGSDTAHTGFRTIPPQVN